METERGREGILTTNVSTRVAVGDVARMEDVPRSGGYFPVRSNRASLVGANETKSISLTWRNASLKP